MNSDKSKERAASDLIAEAEIAAQTIVEKAKKTASRLLEDKEEEDRLLNTLDKHFADDNERFRKLTELAEINGQHLSYFNKNLSEVKTMLIEQNVVAKNDREAFEAYRKRTEAMVISYEKDLVIKENDDKRGDTLVKWSLRVGAIGGIGGSVLWIISKLKLLQ